MEHTFVLPGRRSVGEVMTYPAVTLQPDALFAEIVACFEKHHISAAPVVDGWGRALGVVSEADLLIKTERQEPYRQHWLATRAEFLDDVKAAGSKASELMTSPALTVPPDTTLAKAARLMHERHVKRLPVVDSEGRVLGIVSRADILRVFTRPDADIREDVIEKVIHRAMFLDPSKVGVTVIEGEVWLRGEVERRSEIVMMAGFTAAIDGVVAVHAEELTYRVDDRAIHNVEVEAWPR